MLEILDTTLRDGAQAEGITFSVEDKKQIVTALDDLGVSWIEAGNPGANAQDLQFFRQMAQERPLRNAALVAFGSTCRPSVPPDQDPALCTLCDCPASVKAVFGKSALYHVQHVLRCDPKKNLELIESSIRFLKSRGNIVWFDSEHFFDGWRENEEYAFATLNAAIRGGASRLILCDTRGASLPEEISSIVFKVKSKIKVPLGIHCHNDSGLAAACTLAAVQAGCDHVQGTVGGIGERCGNADLCTLIPLFTLKLNRPCLPEGNLRKITHLSRVVLEIMNIVPRESDPFVGNSAFAHKAGMHIDAILKDPATYEQIDPEEVGNQRRFLLSDQVGRAGVYARLGRLFPELNRDSPEILRVVKGLKEMEARGYTYENADGSFELLAMDILGRRKRYFEVADYHVLCQRYVETTDRTLPTAQAYLKISVGGKEGINAAEGDGPVNALDMALRKTLSDFFPSVSKMSLQDFKVRVLNAEGTASRVRVSIESSDGSHIWNTVGVSENIIEACLRALIDSVDYMMTHYVPLEEISSVLPLGSVMEYNTQSLLQEKPDNAQKNIDSPSKSGSEAASESLYGQEGFRT